MEVLYAKLYEKYEKLKKKKMDEMDEINKHQEEKFLNYVHAAEELIQYLKGENDKLLAEVNKLCNDMLSLRSSKDQQCAEYQNQLLEENMKYKVLYNEFENLQKLYQEKLAEDNKSNAVRITCPQSGQGAAGSSARVTRSMTRKRSRESGAESEGFVDCNQDVAFVTESENSMTRKHKRKSGPETVTRNYHAQDIALPGCCRRTNDINRGASYTCLFQALMECLVGMKISAINHAEGICISVLHQSSGYSFNLSWKDKAAGEETEFIYQVLSLGTFERVAPEWMREVIMFSKNMCPTFFERVSRVIKSH